MAPDDIRMRCLELAVEMVINQTMEVQSVAGLLEVAHQMTKYVKLNDGVALKDKTGT